MNDYTPSINRRSLLRGSVIVAGAAVVLPTFVGLAGCSSPASITDKMDVLAAVTERIIPQTDTGGAIAAKVPEYIAAVFDQHFTEDQQNDFSNGLALLDDAGFASADTEAQDAMLNDFANAPQDSGERAIFQQVLDMAVFGYYTSEVAQTELSYEEIPGRYDACVSLTEIGRAWLDRGV